MEGKHDIEATCDRNLELTRKQNMQTAGGWKLVTAGGSSMGILFIKMALFFVAKTILQMAFWCLRPSAKIKVPSLASWKDQKNTITGWKSVIQFLKENAFLKFHAVCGPPFFKRKEIKTPWSYFYIGNQSLIFKKCFAELFIKMFLLDSLVIWKKTFYK